MRTLALALVLLFSATTFAQTSPDTAAPETTQLRDSNAHPILPSAAIWAGGAVIVILGLFLATLVIGPVVRTELPEEVPIAFSHEENPSHHVGSEHSIWEEQRTVK
jgi:hypothetical protein